MLTLPNIDDFIFRFRYPILIFLLGAILAGLGLFITKNEASTTSDKIEVLTGATESESTLLEIVVEVAGEIERPGVYRLAKDSRIDDLLIAAGGVSSDADRVWMERSLNRAARLTDGQKIYIPAVGEQTLGASAKNFGGGPGGGDNWGSGGLGLTNINSASQKQLEDLPGIGPVYAQNIIEHRPYSNIEELLIKGILKKSTYEKIKDLVTIY
ncbi:MAG: helix-hairpin-helix domain-containing protein [Patescibacteria group bacterium]